MCAAREARNEEAADELGCTHATVRSYWRRIFEKTGRSSAREVITLLFRFAVAPARRNHEPLSLHSQEISHANTIVREQQLVEGPGRDGLS
jgi:hypothetical protein